MKDRKKSNSTVKNTFLDGKKRSAENFDTHWKERKATNKQTAPVAALEKQLEEQHQVTELAVVLQGASNNGWISSKARSETLTWKFIAIVARKNSDKNSP